MKKDNWIYQRDVGRWKGEHQCLSAAVLLWDLSTPVIDAYLPARHPHKVPFASWPRYRALLKR